MERPTQLPAPGSRGVYHRGDVLRFELTLPAAAEGRAWVRTNIGHASVRRQERIHHVERERPLLARDWHDIPMRRESGQRHAVSLPLLETGCFEAKCLFLPAGQGEPVWPEGANVRVKVEAADTCCANTIYTAFVRQFVPGAAAPLAEGAADPARAAESLEALGYTVIPRSGTFRDLIRRLDVILDGMGYRILQLLPIHPAPTTFARMGRFGSPFAVLDFLAVDPALAEFDRRTTPLDQFRELVHAVHRRGARLFLDIPVNHTGWASVLQMHHPEWFERSPDAAFRSPGAWGVTWEDLSQLDYRVRPLWRYLADVFLYWCAQGVDGFRCDAGYMVPYPVWEYVVAKVREQYPDTVFLLEGLGGKIEVTEALLGDAGLDWAYSEVFQQYDRGQLDGYLPGALHTSRTLGRLVHFAETHDNNRLAARSQAHARLRCCLSAMFADAGTFGITNGVEWYASDKVDVHGCPSLRWGAEPNQVALLARLNAILAAHPAFAAGADLALVHTDGGNVQALRRRPAGPGACCLVVVNLDEGAGARVTWRAAEFADAGRLVDLVHGGDIAVQRAGERRYCDLAPGEVRCLSPRPEDLQDVARALASRGEPPRVREQELRAKALDVLVHLHGLRDMDRDEMAARWRELARDPAAYCESAAGGAPCVTHWRWPDDARRTVLVPPGGFLCIRAPHRFLALLRQDGLVIVRERALRADDGSWFALLMPCAGIRENTELRLAMVVYEGAATTERETPVLYLGSAAAQVRRVYPTAEVLARQIYGLCTNGRGAMAQVQGAWGTLRSQYDALLAANLDPLLPVDRRVMLTRCRAWLVYRGYSHELGADCLETFAAHEDGTVSWRFSAPAGLGKLVPLSVHLRLCPGENRCELAFSRHVPAGPHGLEEDGPVTLIVRPDVEDRSFHEVTKAYQGAEHAWPRAVRSTAGGFAFSPCAGHALHMAATPGAFTCEPEWKYMVGHPLEAERGLEPNGDLFSPGYFTLTLRGGETAWLVAEAVRSGDAPRGAAGGGRPAAGTREHEPLRDAIQRALTHFVVKRGTGDTVIAGYPWFLDWGRDTLICLRGLIAAGRIAESRMILQSFAALERNGTLPNMLLGGDDTNRDTTDAPLWFLVACRDLLQATKDAALLSMPCGGRALREVLRSIARGYLAGTPNGIRVDAQSGLVFSPPHFTWMDTNHPAATPREGYPIEIQALWHAGLVFLSEVFAGEGEWAQRAATVRESVRRLFVREGQPWLADCLHARPGQTAAQAEADDALRPNQLLAVTLGCVTDPARMAAIVRSCEELVVPGAIRSLADRPVARPIPVWHRGVALNDPRRPYWGHYHGDEDTRRKPAYHNGCAWTWLFPSYAEALYLAFGEKARATAVALLGSATDPINRDCAGHVPEILDGDTPHTGRGCGAQAWGASELYRVLARLGPG